MKVLTYTIIFLICIVFYIHIIYHSKISDDENIYEIDYTNKYNLEKICNLRQPFSFKVNINYSLTMENLLPSKGIFNIIKEKKVKMKDDESIVKYYSEYNKNLLDDKLVLNEITNVNKYLCPEFSFNNKYDIILSDERFKTPLVNNYNYRNYYIVTEGSIKVRFIHPNNKDILYDSDYELMQNVSELDVWKKDSKLSYKEISFTKGDVIYIPPHWWYSIFFTESSIILKLHYRTAMNMVTYIPYYIYSFISIVKHSDDHLKDKNLKLKT